MELSTFIVQVHEKEARIRIMMRMMGLGTPAYWTINYAFWTIIYIVFTLIFSGIAVAVRLPSGYRIGLFTLQVFCVPYFSGRKFFLPAQSSLIMSSNFE